MLTLNSAALCAVCTHMWSFIRGRMLTRYSVEHCYVRCFYILRACPWSTHSLHDSAVLCIVCLYMCTVVYT
jgi:hypothetical protein